LLAQGGEMLLILLAAATVALLGLKFVEQEIPDLFSRVGWRSGVVAVMIMAGLIGLAAHVYLRSGTALLRLGLSYLLFVAFFIVSGLIPVGLIHGFPWTALPAQTPEIIGSIAAAWLGGWLTPGAPSGIGVRESIIILILSPQIGGDVAAFMAIAYRIVTVVGDLLFALFGLILAQVWGNWDSLLLGRE
jgi:hypothetical protein